MWDLGEKVKAERRDGVPSVRTSKCTYSHRRVRKPVESSNGVKKQNLLGSENPCRGTTRLLLGKGGTGRQRKNRKEKGLSGSYQVESRGATRF